MTMTTPHEFIDREQNYRDQITQAASLLPPPDAIHEFNPFPRTDAILFAGMLIALGVPYADAFGLVIARQYKGGGFHPREAA
jgi:hypothetical protein